MPGSPFEFKRQDSLDLYIALGVEPETFEAMLEKAKAESREVRGAVDHRFVRSIYFYDPNGYVIELTASRSSTGISRNWRETDDHGADVEPRPSSH